MLHKQWSKKQSASNAFMELPGFSCSIESTVAFHEELPFHLLLELMVFPAGRIRDMPALAG